jgi:DNA-binding winged helix-turn-helix (wHTH) protein/tetratricopeptide (TPR) repeat protein
LEVDLRSGEVRKNGSRIRLQAQPFQLLALLLLNAGEVVTRDEICRDLWPANTFVDFEHSLAAAVNKIREALGDSADNPKYIETLPKRGYRFIGKIRREPPMVMAVADAQEAVELVPAPSAAQMPAGASATGVWPKLAERATRFSWAAIIGATVVIAGLAASGWRFFPRKTHLLTEKDTIVLADFVNTSGDMVFDGTLRQGLSVQLEQSPFLRILSDQQIQQTLQMMGQKSDAKLTPGIARELCQRTGSAAVLDGSIAQIGSRYLLTLKAVNCSSGELLSSAEAQASDKSHVLDALGKTASEIRNKLGESLASIQKFDVPLEQVTTSSLEALKIFSVYARGGGLVPALPMLLHVVELDPNFADAYAQLSDAYDDLGETDLASENAQKAFDRRDRVSERERLSITAKYYYYTLGDLDQELRTHRVFEQVYPRAWGPWNDASGTWRILGDHERALKEAREALRLNPDAVNPYLNVGSALLCLERKEEARQIAKQALAHGIEVPGTHLLIYQIAFLENDNKEMEAQLGPFLGESGKEPSLEALFVQSSTDAHFGRLKSSLTYSERALEIAKRNNFHELAAQVHAIDALREAEFGDFGRARQDAGMALTLSSGRSAKLFTALALARAGQVRSAQALVDELDRRFPSNTLMKWYWLPTIRGSIELARQNPAKAIAALQSVSYELGDVGFSAGNGNLYPVYVRGQAYLETHQGKEAAAEFQKFLDHRSIALNSPLAALAHLGLARAYSLQGDSAKARGSYENFLALWKHADRDVPILKQAKAEYARLQ